MYEIEITAEGLRHLNKLPEKVRHAALESTFGPIVENQARIVALSKTIHHLLPYLLPPIDRMYTQEFFGIHSPQFQYQQERAFQQIWEQYVVIARAVDPTQYVGSGWRTSRSKVIDNAVVAFVHRGREHE